ncbi:ATP-binding protein [uncultured Algibacter sp.]|uniref:tetratricopeptide repeat-containing sensor histidine kinase n=1 Tax=uncultured Algibacter sp. TaxID=298659 RepID=UPI0032173BDC
MHFSLFAQSEKDYCEEWKTSNDTMRNFKRSLEYNYKMLDNVDLKCKASIYLSNGILYQDQQKNDSTISNLNSAIKICKELNLNKILITAYLRKSYFLAELNKISEAKDLLIKAKIALQDTPNNKDWNLYFQAQAYLSDINSDYDNSISLMDSAIAFSQKIKNKPFIQNGYHNKGTYLMRISDYENAIKSFLSGAKQSENGIGLENQYIMIASCYTRLNQDETALKYFKKALEAAKKSGNDFVTMLVYARMSSSQLSLKRIDKAMISIDSAISKAKKAKNYGILGSAYEDKASTYFRYLKDYDKAEFYYEKSYSNSLKANTSKKSDDLLKTTTIQGMINLYLAKKNYQKAKIFLKTLEEKANKSGLLMYKSTSNRLHSEYYEAIGQPSKAIKYLREHYKIEDSISNEKVKTQVANLEKQYDTKNKELQIVKLDKEKTEQQQLVKEAKAKQRYYFFAAIVLLSLLIIGFWLFRKLKKQKEELGNTNKVKNRLFSIIAHDLRGMIIPFQRSGKILEHYIENKDYDKTIVFSQELQKNSEGLSNMLDNLLNWSLEQMNGYKMNPELLYVNNELESIKANFLQQAEFKNTKISIINDEEIAMNMDKGAFHIIFRNLIGNALKYTDNGTIRLGINREINTLKCSIIDTGVGMDKEQLKDIFSLETKTSSTGTKGEKGAGLGLSLVYRFIKMNGGTIEVSSEKRVGTKFDLSFPLSEFDIAETEKINAKELSA